MKTKEAKARNNGITLIALVVTIIVLLILAGVSIAMLTGQNGILTQAQRAKEETEQATVEEQKGLTQMEANINLENTEYVDSKGKKAIIPAGFAVSSIEEERNIDTGLVVIDKNGNEFVWIPVENVVANDTSEANNKKAMSLLDSSTGNYSGIIYDFKVNEDNSITSSVRTTNYFEPKLAVWNDTDQQLGKYGYGSKEEFLETMQTEYNNMVISVNGHKGFYIGRYETSINEKGEVESKKGALPYSGPGITWYELYENQKKIDSTSVKSSMIWGSQYHAILNWIISNKNYSLLGITRNETEKVACGSNENDIINNIYDLTGNTFEWTLTQGSELNARMRMGGYFSTTGNSLTRGYTNSGHSGETNGSRMILYIK